ASTSTPRHPKNQQGSCAKRRLKSLRRSNKRCLEFRNNGLARPATPRGFSLYYMERRGTQVVRERSAKPLCVSSILTRASKFKVIQSRKVGGTSPGGRPEDRSAGNLDAHREGRRLAQVLETGC